MTDEAIEIRAKMLRDMTETDGWKILAGHIEEEKNDGWKGFIRLPVAQKTGKESFNCQARYEVLDNLQEWLKSEIKQGD